MVAAVGQADVAQVVAQVEVVVVHPLQRGGVQRHGHHLLAQRRHLVGDTLHAVLQPRPVGRSVEHDDTHDGAAQQRIGLDHPHDGVVLTEVRPSAWPIPSDRDIVHSWTAAAPRAFGPGAQSRARVPQCPRERPGAGWTKCPSDREPPFIAWPREPPIDRRRATKPSRPSLTCSPRSSRSTRSPPPRRWASTPTSGAPEAVRTCGAPSPRSSRCRARPVPPVRCTAPSCAARWPPRSRPARACC